MGIQCQYTVGCALGVMAITQCGSTTVYIGIDVVLVFSPYWELDSYFHFKVALTVVHTVKNALGVLYIYSSRKLTHSAPVQCD